MYDPNAMQAVFDWLPVLFLIGVVILGGIFWSVLR